MCFVFYLMCSYLLKRPIVSRFGWSCSFPQNGAKVLRIQCYLWKFSHWKQSFFVCVGGFDCGTSGWCCRCKIPLERINPWWWMVCYPASRSVTIKQEYVLLNSENRRPHTGTHERQPLATSKNGIKTSHQRPNTFLSIEIALEIRSEILVEILYNSLWRKNASLSDSLEIRLKFVSIELLHITRVVGKNSIGDSKNESSQSFHFRLGWVSSLFSFPYRSIDTCHMLGLRWIEQNDLLCQQERRIRCFWHLLEERQDQTPSAIQSIFKP